MSEPAGLSDVSLTDLRALLQAVEQARVPCPLEATALSASGFAHAAAEVTRALSGLSREGVTAALRIAIAERVHRPPPRLDLVWTGPEARTSTSRDTAVVVRQLFAEAQESVLVGGFRFDRGEDLFRPLHEGMQTRGVRAKFFLDIEGEARDPSGAAAFADAQITRFFDSNWPFDDPRPSMYYDPRTAVAGPPWASLHAKCVVVDERRAFITSANFTDRGQTRNIEAGVLIDDPDFATSLVAQWERLIAAGLVRRYGDGGDPSQG